MRFFRLVTLTLAVAASAAPAYAATCAPSTLVHIVLTDVTPGIDPASFAGQPRIYYRAGNDKLRIEEALDKPNGIQGLVVIAEPNIWMINLFDKSGKHIVDPGPTFNAIAPVIAIQGLPPKLSDLQLGCEAEYLAANVPKPTRTERVGNTDFSVFRITEGDDALEVLERPGTNIPAYARYYHQGTLTLALRYDVYERGLPADPALFVPPPGIQMTETGGS